MLFWFYITMIVLIGSVCGIITKAIDSKTKLRRKQLEENAKTNNLALIYQIINTRPDITVQEIGQLLQLSDNSMTPRTMNQFNEHKPN